MNATSVSVARAQGVARLGAFLELTKPRIAALVLVVVAASTWVAADGAVSLPTMLHALLGTALIAGSSCAINQWLERGRDALMDRTAQRPLPSGRLSSMEAIVFGLATLIVGFVYLAMLVNVRSAFLGLATWVVYIGLYTPLKPVTTLNTAIGALAGAGPVLIGWKATGRTLDFEAGMLFAALFIWQFPHFMAIAWLCRKQYSRAGMMMSTVADPTGRGAGWQAVIGAAALVVVAAVPGLLSGHPVLKMAAVALGAAQLVCSVDFFARRDDVSARRLLRASLVYLPALLLLLVVAPLI